MSAKSDNAPVLFERTDHDNAGALSVKFVIAGKKYRAGVEFKDDCTPALVVYKLNSLALTIVKMIRKAHG